jgi:hypothetical protein
MLTQLTLGIEMFLERPRTNHQVPVDSDSDSEGGEDAAAANNPDAATEHDTDAKESDPKRVVRPNSPSSMSSMDMVASWSDSKATSPASATEPAQTKRTGAKHKKRELQNTIVMHSKTRRLTSVLTVSVFVLLALVFEVSFYAVSIGRSASFMGHCFQISIYLVIQVSDSHDHQRTHGSADRLRLRAHALG